MAHRTDVGLADLLGRGHDDFLECEVVLRVFGEDRLEVLFTPGHSPGSLSFYHAAGGWVLSGDVLFRESVGRSDLPGGDQPTLERSIREVLYRLPDETVVLSGHGPSTTIGHEKKSNPYVPG